MLKFFTSFRQYFQCKFCKVESVPATKLPFFAIIFLPLSLMTDNTKRFLLIGLFFSFLLTVLALVFGYGYMCSYPDYVMAGNYCRNSNANYLVYLILRFAVISAFMGIWYRACFQNISLSWSLFYDFKNIGRSFLALTIFLAINAIALVALYMLKERVPNPNWRIELAYFAAVGIWMLVPFFIIRLYSLLAFVWGNEKLPSVFLVLRKNSGNMLRIMSSLLLLFFMSIFIFLGYYRNFRLVANINAVYISFMVEFLYNLLVLIIVAIFVNHCYLQKFYLFGRKKDEE